MGPELWLKGLKRRLRVGGIWIYTKNGGRREGEEDLLWYIHGYKRHTSSL